MRPLSLWHALGMLVLIATVSVSPARAQRQTTGSGGFAMPAPAPEQLTAKERLAEKWTDRQRIDNCKVPVDKRGSTPRPDVCAGAAASPSLSVSLVRPRQQ